MSFPMQQTVSKVVSFLRTSDVVDRYRCPKRKASPVRDRWCASPLPLGTQSCEVPSRTNSSNKGMMNVFLFCFLQPKVKPPRTWRWRLTYMHIIYMVFFFLFSLFNNTINLQKHTRITQLHPTKSSIDTRERRRKIDGLFSVHRVIRAVGSDKLVNCWYILSCI